MKNISTIILIAVSILLVAACSKQTQKVADANPSSEQRSKTDRPARNGQRGGPPTFDQLLTEMDSNQDGRLAASEVQGRLQKDFAKIDTNADGFITEEEMKNAPKPARRGRNQN